MKRGAKIRSSFIFLRAQFTQITLSHKNVCSFFQGQKKIGKK